MTESALDLHNMDKMLYCDFLLLLLLHGSWYSVVKMNYWCDWILTTFAMVVRKCRSYNSSKHPQKHSAGTSGINQDAQSIQSRILWGELLSGDGETSPQSTIWYDVSRGGFRKVLFKFSLKLVIMDPRWSKILHSVFLIISDMLEAG